MAWLKGCDFSFSKPNLQQLWDAGYRVILVYLSDVSSKGVTPAYAAEALSIGFKILPLYETTAGAALGGYSTGVAHATTATRIAANLGIPPEVPIIYALDQDFSTAQLAGSVTRYVEGLNAVHGDDALYGGYNQLGYLIRHGLAGSQNFQTYAWSGGKWLPVDQAPVEQFHNGVSVAGGVVDDCRVQDNLIFWEKDMAITAADAKLIAAAVWAADVIPVDPTNSTNPTWRADNTLATIYFQGKKPFPTVPTAAQVASAVIEALPPSSGGVTPPQITVEDVTNAVLAALAKLKLSLSE